MRVLQFCIFLLLMLPSTFGGDPEKWDRGLTQLKISWFVLKKTSILKDDVLSYIVGLKVHSEDPIETVTFITQTMFITNYIADIGPNSMEILQFYFNFLKGDTMSYTPILASAMKSFSDHLITISELPYETLETHRISPVSLIMPANHYTRDENYRFLYAAITLSDDDVFVDLDFAFLISPGKNVLNGVHHAVKGSAVRGSPLLARDNSYKLGVVAIIAKVRSDGSYNITEVGDYFDEMQKLDQGNVVKMAPRTEIYSQIDYIPKHPFVVPFAYDNKTDRMRSSAFVSVNVALTYENDMEYFVQVEFVMFYLRTHSEPIWILDMGVYYNDGLVAMVLKKADGFDCAPVAIVNRPPPLGLSYYFFLTQQLGGTYYVIGDNITPEFSLNSNRNFAGANVVADTGEIGSVAVYKRGAESKFVGIIAYTDKGNFFVRDLVGDLWLNAIISITRSDSFPFQLGESLSKFLAESYVANVTDDHNNYGGLLGFFKLLERHLNRPRLPVNNALMSIRPLMNRIINEKDAQKRTSYQSDLRQKFVFLSDYFYF